MRCLRLKTSHCLVKTANSRKGHSKSPQSSPAKNSEFPKIWKRELLGQTKSKLDLSSGEKPFELKLSWTSQRIKDDKEPVAADATWAYYPWKLGEPNFAMSPKHMKGIYIFVCCIHMCMYKHIPTQTHVYTYICACWKHILSHCSPNPDWKWGPGAS